MSSPENNKRRGGKCGRGVGGWVDGSGGSPGNKTFMSINGVSPRGRGRWGCASSILT